MRRTIDEQIRRYLQIAHMRNVGGMTWAEISGALGIYYREAELIYNHRKNMQGRFEGVTDPSWRNIENGNIPDVELGAHTIDNLFSKEHRSLGIIEGYNHTSKELRLLWFVFETGRFGEKYYWRDMADDEKSYTLDRYPYWRKILLPEHYEELK